MNPQPARILVQRQNGEKVAEYSLGPGTHVVGRETSAGVRVESDFLSRIHAVLHLTDTTQEIEDHGSTSGTFINGVAVRGRVPLAENQAVQMGDLFFTVQRVQHQTTVDRPPELYLANDLAGGGRYSLHHELGRGARGVVWLARDQHLEEQVALKRLPPELAADPVALGDLKREVQKAHRLSHPHIIRIHDLVQLPDEQPFIAMEYVEGADLDAYRAQQPGGFYRWETLLPLALQMCDALAYAHQQHIVHRDLKPANMMLNREGHLKLADFGIAANSADAATRDGMEGDASGTAAYMSPQQMQGQTATPGDDLYALGATLYDLLSTQPPFYDGDIVHLVQEAPAPTLHQQLEQLGIHNPIPNHVHDAIMSCLAKDPTQRPADAATLGQLLHPDLAPPPVPPEFQPETESVLTEPIEKTQRYLEENLPQPVTHWWSTQSSGKQQILAITAIILGLLFAEITYSKLTKKGFFKTLRQNHPFLPWPVHPANPGKPTK